MDLIYCRNCETIRCAEGSVDAQGCYTCCGKCGSRKIEFIGGKDMQVKIESCILDDGSGWVLYPEQDVACVMYNHQPVGVFPAREYGGYLLKRWRLFQEDDVRDMWLISHTVGWN